MKVGIVTSIGATTTYHRVEHGEIDCRLARRDDCEFDIVARHRLPEAATPCRVCFGEPDIHTGGNTGWATRLRQADNPEEVIRS